MMLYTYFDLKTSVRFHLLSALAAELESVKLNFSALNLSNVLSGTIDFGGMLPMRQRLS